jgi:hypothetical protein
MSERVLFLGRAVAAGSVHIVEVLHVVGSVLLALALLAGASVTFDLANHAPAVIAFWAVAIVSVVIIDGAYLVWSRASEYTRGTLWHAEIGELSATTNVPNGYSATASARGETFTVRVSPASGAKAGRQIRAKDGRQEVDGG